MRVILANYEFVSVFKLVCSADAAMSRRYNALLRPEALANIGAPTVSWKKKVHLFSQSVSRELRKSFTLVPGNPSCQAYSDCDFHSEALWNIVIFVFIYFISCLFLFFHYIVFFFYYFLFNPYSCIWWWGDSSANLESVEYFFIAITPRSTLTRSSTC